ncbi:hypothetical protein OHA21_19895 [Actinoplanes sp. NBC_00393]|uniref:hypothetical protein n=1 Tax=Actinoplanes sp. NBC_00393 TaxID=2975953 RepID=UPI002E2107EC
MSRQVVWGAGVGVVLSAVVGALVNELHAGWPWWIACAVVVLGAALLAMRVASAGTRNQPDPPPGRYDIRQDVKVEGNGRADVVGQGELRIDER